MLYGFWGKDRINEARTSIFKVFGLLLFRFEAFGCEIMSPLFLFEVKGSV